MIGTSPTTMGGISSVVVAYRDGGLFDRFPIEYIATHKDGSKFVKLWALVRALAIYFRRLIVRRDFVLHVHASSRASFWRKCLFILPATWMGRPVIFHLHGSEFMRFYSEECGKFRQHFIRAVMRRCAKIIVLSESWRVNVSRIVNCGNVEVLTNPAVGQGDGKTPEPRAENVLLFLGRLGRRKGIYVLLDALAIIRERFPDVTLICGGDGEQERVLSMATEMGLGEVVNLRGWVAGAEKSELLRTSTLYVLPSYDEGVPMSILEAMAAGLPIVSTPVGGIPDVVSPGIEGMLVPAGDATALAIAICELLGNDSLREQMGRHARERFEREFSIEIVIGRLESIYRSFGVLPRSDIVSDHS